MLRILFAPALAVLLLGATAPAVQNKADVAKDKTKEARSYEIPYKMTVPKHIVVRLKINGKGPFNFILDTGAPALHIATPVGKKAGLRPNENGFATIDTLAIEGGIKLEKVKGHVETPFQLEGMNGMGLAGLEIHGLMGYTVVSKYRMEIDFTRDKMTWTELDYTPKLERIGGKGKGGQGGLEMLGSVMGGVGKFLGRKAAPPVMLQGFFGMTLEDGDDKEHPVVRNVLEKGPAGLAGLQAGDVITHVQAGESERQVITISDMLRVMRGAGKLEGGNRVSLRVTRGNESKQITITSAEGF